MITEDRFPVLWSPARCFSLVCQCLGDDGMQVEMEQVINCRVASEPNKLVKERTFIGVPVRWPVLRHELHAPLSVQSTDRSQLHYVAACCEEIFQEPEEI